ncbi:MAG: hypothetical protein QM697_09940 [Lachnospiraceae bacterium]
MIDFKADEDGLDEFIANVKTVQTDMQNACDKMIAFQQLIQTTQDWVGNGREECAAFLCLLAQYSGLLAGKEVNVSGTGYTTLLDSKAVTGDGDHLTELIEALELFYEQVATFEQNAGEKAQCIRTLDAI